MGGEVVRKTVKTRPGRALTAVVGKGWAKVVGAVPVRVSRKTVVGAVK